MASAWSLRFMIMTLLYSPKHLMEHRHLHDQAVVCFVLHDAARPVEHLIGDRRVAPDRQAMHETTLGMRAREPALAHAPVGERAAQLRIDSRISVRRRGGPLLGINDLRPRERRSAVTRLL